MADIARLEDLAAQLAGRVHDDDPEANLRWLRGELGTDPDAPVSDVERLLFALAAAVPTDRTWRQLTAWTREHGGLREEPYEERRRRYQRDYARRRRAEVA